MYVYLQPRDRQRGSKAHITKQDVEWKTTWLEGKLECAYTHTYKILLLNHSRSHQHAGWALASATLSCIEYVRVQYCDAYLFEATQHAKCISCFCSSLPFLQRIFSPVHYLCLTDVYLLSSLQPMLDCNALLSLMLFHVLCLNSLGTHRAFFLSNVIAYPLPAIHGICNWYCCFVFLCLFLRWETIYLYLSRLSHLQSQRKKAPSLPFMQSDHLLKRAHCYRVSQGRLNTLSDQMQTAAVFSVHSPAVSRKMKFKMKNQTAIKLL